MQLQTAPISKTMLWTGRIMSTVPVLLTLLGSVMKLAKVAPALEGMARAGFPEKFVVPIGMLELICVAAYVIPQTSVLGAILLTGLLGGATVTTLRIGDPTFPLPVVLGMMAWGGLYLRDVRLRELIPLRKMGSGKRGPISGCSTSQQRTRQAGGAAPAVDADLATGEGTDVESRAAQALVGLVVLFDRQQAVFA
jgi:hypothetical protein